MSAVRHTIRRVTISRDVADEAVAVRWRDFALREGLPLVWLDDGGEALHEGKSLHEGKTEVLVTRHRGSAIKPCRGLDRQCVPCNLHVINQTSNCPFDCSYCFLKAYVNQPVTTIHADLDALVTEITQLLGEQPQRLFRVTTGDLGDSLAYDPVSLANARLVECFARSDNGLLELKTKSDLVEPLLDLDHRGRTVVSWSMNTPAMIDGEEHLSAPLERRLEAAHAVVEAGYPVAFHFDPLITHRGWETGYPEVVRRIFAMLPAHRIAWISMGSLRFPASTPDAVEHAIPDSSIALGELKLASDGKIRYLKTIRLGLYRTLYEAICAAGGTEVFTYLCMELPQVWRRVLGRVPEPGHGLDFEFACSLTRRFPYLMKTPPRVGDYRGAPMLGSLS